jgi:1-pyrroline-5-carboxylate dehydrogenase
MMSKHKRIQSPVTRRKRTLPRLTYATLAVTPQDDAAYEAAVTQVRNALGCQVENYVNGVAQSAPHYSAHPSPINTTWIVSYAPQGTREQARAAIQAAQQAFAAWSRMDYRQRIKILRRAADLLQERRYLLAAWMAFEVGKNRAEALAEVFEAIELIRYYCEQMEKQRGFVIPLQSPGKGQKTQSVLRPYGVWAVISPWNFPLALAVGMSAGALVAGNTVVFKPSSQAPVMGYEIYRAYADAGLPAGVFNLVFGAGGTVGAELQENPHVDGLIFTGSYAVGIQLYKSFASHFPKPLIAEMGGKNPAIVCASADLDEAAEGVMRAAFGFGGQKCSACSRVYVHHQVKDAFLQRLVEYTQQRVRVGDPTHQATFMGPVINHAAVDVYLESVQTAQQDGGIFHTPGARLSEGELANGYFVSPAIVELPKTHRLFQDELFLPFVVVTAVESLEEAVSESNRSMYGLCAGIYTREPSEIEYFFEHIQAGVTYVNRRAGATTGAWPGVNSFGGWKASGTTGKNALGPYYVQQFMREQSRWIVT